MAKYLDRSIHTLGCNLALFTTEDKFNKELKRLKVPAGQWPVFSQYPNMATVHYLENRDGSKLALVTVADMADRDGLLVSSYLVHEAVHIWQFHLEIVGDERSHSKEFEAYGIQSIYQTLANEYARQKGLV